MEETMAPVPSGNEGDAGTLDGAPAALQMRAVDYALRVYFDTDQWLQERDHQMPGLRRR